jgi:hypothetical protein
VHQAPRPQREQARYDEGEPIERHHPPLMLANIPRARVKHRNG